MTPKAGDTVLVCKHYQVGKKAKPLAWIAFEEPISAKFKETKKSVLAQHVGVCLNCYSKWQQLYKGEGDKLHLFIRKPVVLPAGITIKEIKNG